MIGDSVGARFEGMEHAAIRHRDATAEKLVEVAPGPYTAVTEMTAAVAESLSEHPEFDGADMAARLLDYHSAERGYGQGTVSSYERLSHGCPWNEAGLGEAGRGCFGNGAASRSAAVGLLGTEDAEWLRWVAEEAAGITHQHALGCEGAALLALAVALALSSRGRRLSGSGFLERLAAETQLREFRSRLETAVFLVEGDREPKVIVDRLGNNSTALGSVVTALYCFAAHPATFDDAVALAASLGGNASAVAAMTGAVSGAHLGRDALPRHWVDGLQVGRVSPQGLGALARRLAELSR